MFSCAVSVFYILVHGIFVTIHTCNVVYIGHEGGNYRVWRGWMGVSIVVVVKIFIVRLTIISSFAWISSPLGGAPFKPY